MRRYRHVSAYLLIFTIGIAVASPAPAAAQAAAAESSRTDSDASANSLKTTLEQQAAEGNAQAQLALGDLYAQGNSLPADEEQAVLWWRKAAEQGLAEAQNELGSALAAGRGVRSDRGQAVAWFRRAAEQGLAVAQANLGLMYWEGVAARADPREAVVWFRRAADQGLAWAQIYLGDAYARGRGIRRDEKQAAEWYRKAALQDYRDAQAALGAMYARGRGVAHDNGEAVRWFALAARQGSEAAQQSLQNIAAGLRRVKLTADVAVREEPDLTSNTIRTSAAGEYAYVMQRENGWTEVYLADGHTVGFIGTTGPEPVDGPNSPVGQQVQARNTTLEVEREATAAAVESPETSEQELDEVLVDGRRPLRNSRAVVAWLARLVGEFTVEGTVNLHGRSDADLLGVQGRSSCAGFGSEPAVMCQLNIRWPQVRGREGETIAGAIANLDPAIIMFGFEPTRVGIHHMLVGNDSVADGGLGYLLSDDMLVMRAKCGGVVGACERVVRITAEPDAQTVRMEIDMEIDLRKAVTISFAMHRVPGPPSVGNPDTRQ